MFNHVWFLVIFDKLAQIQQIPNQGLKYYFSKRFELVDTQLGFSKFKQYSKF